MDYGFCHLAVVPLRAKPFDASEMVSQLLFGEVFRVLEKAEKWTKILTTYDSYEAWIDNKQFLPISAEEHTSIAAWQKPVVEITQVEQAGNLFNILPGSSLPNSETFTVAGKKFHTTIQKENTPKGITETALVFLNAPYLWGGRSLFGIDCSGFVQLVFGITGTRLLRDAYLQAQQGNTVETLNNIRKNDLLFFDNAEGKIIHVGIYLGVIFGEAKIIHASGCVRIDSIDEQGIYNQDLQSYTHHLHSILRF